jgi:UrcA family protein
VRTLRKTIPALVLVGAACVSAMQASAAEPRIARDTDGRPTITVSVRDLDLGLPGDVQELYARVQSAATAVCDTTARAEWLGGQPPPVGWHSRCVRSAVSNAVRDLGIRNLSVLHFETQGLIAKVR